MIVKTGEDVIGTKGEVRGDKWHSLRLLHKEDGMGVTLVDALLALTKSDDERVRLGAIQAALDRGWGKATQHTEAEISVYDSLSYDDKVALLAALDSLDGDEEGAQGGPVPPHH